MALSQYAQSILAQIPKAIKDGNLPSLLRLYELAVTHGISAPRIDATRLLLEACLTRVATMKHIEQIESFRKLMSLSEADVPISVAAQVVPSIAHLEQSDLTFRPGTRSRMRAVRAYLKTLSIRIDDDHLRSEEATLLDSLLRRKIVALDTFLAGRGERRVLLSVLDENEASEWAQAIEEHVSSTANMDSREPIRVAKMHRWEAVPESTNGGQWVPCVVKLVSGVLAVFVADERSIFFLSGGEVGVLDKSTLLANDSLTSRGLPYTMHSVVHVVEGRDLTLCDPDLLTEARAQLFQLKQDKAISELDMLVPCGGDAKMDNARLKSRVEMLLGTIEESTYTNKPAIISIVRAARSFTRSSRKETCIATLRRAIALSDMQLLQATVRDVPEAIAEHPVVASALKIAAMPASEQLLHRFARLVRLDQDGAISSMYSSILSAKGESPAIANKFCDFELQHIARLNYNKFLTEPEDLYDIYEELNTAITEVSNGGRSDSRSLLDMFVKERKSRRPQGVDHTLSYLDCDRLRSAAEFPTASSFRRMDRNRNLGEFKHLLFSTQAIRISLTRPPVHVDSKRTYNELSTRAFDVLRKLTCPKEATEGGERLRRKDSVIADKMANNRAVHEAAVEFLTMGLGKEYIRDELYAQLIKQLNHNIYRGSRWCAWTLFVLCLRTFAPSADLAPFLRAHVHGTLLAEEEQQLGTQDQTIEDRDFAQKLVSVAKLCVVLLDRWPSCGIPEGADARKDMGTKYIDGAVPAGVIQPSFGLVVGCFKSQPVELEVIIASYEKPVVVSAPMLAAALHGGIVGLLESEIGRFWNGTTVEPWPGNQANQLWHGFDFYIAKKTSSPLSLEPQPRFLERVDWNEDAHWGRVMLNTPRGNDYCFTLRRTAGSRHESFCQDFNPPVLLAATYDSVVVDRRGLWVAWLSADGSVPFDAVRISLLYGEERLAMSRTLYASGYESGLGYLLALQVVIDLSPAEGAKKRGSKEKWRVNQASKLDRLGLLNTSPEAKSIFLSTLSYIEELEKAVGSSLNVQRFYYFLQRAYVSYAMVWPFYGTHFFEGGVVLENSSFGDGSDRSVRVAVSTEGVTLLTSQNEQLGKIALANIKAVSISPLASELVLCDVGDAKLELRMGSTIDARAIVEILSTSALVAVSCANVDAAKSNRFGATLAPQSEGGQLLRYIYDFCPTLPPPPAPPTLKEIALFVLPASRHDSPESDRESLESKQTSSSLIDLSSKRKRARRQSAFTSQIATIIQRNVETRVDSEVKHVEEGEVQANLSLNQATHHHAGYDRALLLGCVSGVAIQPTTLVTPKLPSKTSNGRMRVTRPLAGSARLKRPPQLIETSRVPLLKPLFEDDESKDGTADMEQSLDAQWWDALKSEDLLDSLDVEAFDSTFEKRIYTSMSFTSRLENDVAEPITGRL
jgi:hypothetical protein